MEEKNPNWEGHSAQTLHAYEVIGPDDSYSDNGGVENEILKFLIFLSICYVLQGVR